MAKGLVEQSSLVAIADAIRAKGVEGTWKPAEMPDAIASITTGGSGGDDDDLYKSGDEAYQDLRPTNWLAMPDMDEVVATYPGGTIYYLTYVKTSNTSEKLIKSGMSNEIYNIHVYTNTKGWVSAGSGNSITIDTNGMDGHEEGFYDCVVAWIGTHENCIYNYGTWSGVNCVFDIDIYYPGSTAVSNSNYWSNFNNFSNLQFLRVRTENIKTLKLGAAITTRFLQVIRGYGLYCSEYFPACGATRFMEITSDVLVQPGRTTCYAEVISLRYSPTATNQLLIGNNGKDSGIRKLIINPDTIWSIGIITVYSNRTIVEFGNNYRGNTIPVGGSSGLLMSYGSMVYSPSTIIKYVEALVSGEERGVISLSNKRVSVQSNNILTEEQEQYITNLGFTVTYAYVQM